MASTNANNTAHAVDTLNNQTIGGVKTFTGANTIINGGVYAYGGVIELGSSTGASTPFIDFHTTAGANDYDSRIIATGGTAGTNGQGILNYTAGGGHVFTGNTQFTNSFIKLYSATSLSGYLYLTSSSGSYSPFLRSNSSTAGQYCVEVVNSANTNVNFTVFDDGRATVRQTLNIGNAVNANKTIIGQFGPGYGAAIVCNPIVDGATALITTSTGGATAGSIVINGTTTAYNTSSDYRIKSNYAPITGARDTLNQIKFYNGNIEEVADKVDYVIAHELQEVLPFAVHGEKDAMGIWTPIYREGFDPTQAEPTADDIVDVKQDRELQAVDYSKLIPRIGAAVQEQDAVIVTLQAQVADLLDRIAKLEAK